MENTKPVNIGNADCINETCYPVMKLAMLRYEAIFDYYSEEPQSIYVRLEKDGEKFDFEQILRIRKWVSDNQSYSWCIYSQRRELDNKVNENLSEEKKTLKNLIIRYVIWNMKTDINNIKQFSDNRREQLLKNYPSISTNNIFLSLKDSIDLIKQICDFDKLIENGISLSLNSNQEWSFRDLEIKRLFDWGQVHSTWSPFKENHEVETSILEIEKNLKKYLACDYVNIYSMDLDFSISPVIYKNIVVGEKIDFQKL